jgi:hypothetical protein
MAKKMSFSMGEAYQKKNGYNVMVLYWMVANSWYDKKVRKISKQTISARKVARETEGVSERAVWKTISRLVEMGYLEEEKTEYIVHSNLNGESFVSIDLELGKRLVRELPQETMKTYLFLARRKKMGMQSFTLGDISSKALGREYGNAFAYRKVHEALDLLTEKELVKYVTIPDGETYRKKLIWVKGV